jgi:phosphoadenosine phosphosulfate reductase
MASQPEIVEGEWEGGPLLAEERIGELNQRFEALDPMDILRWALIDSGLERVSLASAFQAEGTAVMHMAVQLKPDVPVLFLDTGFHFPETLRFKKELTERLGLNVVDLRGEFFTPEEQARAFGDRLYERDPDRCCEINKVIPLTRALSRLDAWITSIRRDSSPTRASAPIVDQYELKPGKFLVKVNPVAHWTRVQVREYLREHRLSHNPLYEQGYAQIGCWPCTRVQLPGEPERAGRWAGLAKWECGIHLDRVDRSAEVEPSP